MNSIYIRCITTNLVTHKDKRRKCAYCNEKHAEYRCGLLVFCTIKHANIHHKTYDIAAATHGIFALLWFRELGLNDTAIVVSSFLYRLRKRVAPPDICASCLLQSSNIHYANDTPFCSIRCRDTFLVRIKGYPYGTFRVYPVSRLEMQTEYIW